MADRSRTSDIDRLSEAVQCLRKSLECTICLDFIKDPIKTRCGHSFCRACIWEVLQIKKPACPLCQKGLTRRNISKDDHMQTCIEKFIKLISAIQADSKIDILSHLKHPRDTRESCSYTDASGSNRSTGKRKPSNRPAVSARRVSANSDRQTDKASTSRGTTAIDRDNSQDDTNLPNQPTVTDSSAVYPLSAEHDDSYCKPDIKVRTWLRSFSGESAADLETVDETTEGKATHSLIPDDNGKSSSGTRLVKSKNRRTGRGRKRKVGSERFDEDNTSRPDTKSSRKKDLSTSGLKYDKIHARTRKKDNRKDEEEKKSSVDESAIDASDRANLDTSSANWSRVIEFGKEMRDKKKTVKKLNVRTEKNKPKIVESVVLSPRSMIDLVKMSGNTDVRFTCETNVCHSLVDERDREQDAADTSPRVSTPLKRPKKVKDAANSSTSDHSMLETSFITLEENRKVRITKLNNDQVSEILGFGVTEGEEDSRNRRRMTAASSTTSQTPKRLIVLTEKLNEGDRKTPIDSGSVSYLPAGNRSLGAREKDSEAQRTSGEIDFPPMRTPKKSRLSLKRKLASSDDKSAADSPLLDRFSLTDKSSAGEHEKDADDREGVNSPKARDTEVPDRLARDRARRNVNTRIDEDRSRTDRSGTLAASSLRSRDDGDRGVARRDEKLVSDFAGGSRKSRKLETPGHDSRVKFVQLGSMNRRRQTKYYYLGKMSGERSLAAEIQDVSVYNMQQSISKSEMIKRVADTPRGLATSPSDDSQASVVALEAAQYLAKSLNRPAAGENPMLPAAISTYSFAAISTPRRDIDRRTRHSSTNARTNELIEDKENARSSKMPCEDGKAFREISRVSSSRSPVRLLSPDEDSQLKFLETDSPMNERAFKRENSTQRRPEHEKAIARDYFFQTGQSPLAASTSKKRESSSENFDKKRKRYVANKEMFEDESDDDPSDDPADDDPRPSANSRDRRDKSSKDAKSDANKRRCLSSANEDIEVISDSDVREAPVKKFRRIITIPSPSTESESHCTPVKCSRRDERHDQPSRASVADEFTAQGPRDKQVDQEKRIRNILQNWNREHNEMISRDDTEIISKGNTPSGVKRTTTGIPPEEESATRQSSSGVTENALEKRSANRKDCESMKESQMFESNSIFHSDNLDYIMEETGIGASDKLANSSNNDIINRVLRIDRDNSDARQSQIAAAPRSDGTSQRGKTAGDGDYLLRDNFDEIIANVDLSQRMIPRGTPSGRSPDRTPAREKTSNCPAMTDEPRGATREAAPVSIPASTNDIFEHGGYSDRNAERRPLGASGNSDKENVARGRKKYAIDGDPGGKIRRETSLDRGDGTWIDAERHRVGDDSARKTRNPSGDQSRNSQNDDSIMNVTRDQLRLRIFEEDLFGVAPSGSPTEAANVTSRDDLYQEASTPKREGRGDLRDKNMSPREHADENDVVENTPESKIKKTGSRNIATADSRRNIAISFLTPKSTDWTPVSTPKTPIVEKIPFCQSTPRETSDPIVAGCLNVRTEIRKTELATHGVVLPATRRATSETLEDNRQRPDGETPCIVCSSLTITQTKTVKDFVAKYRMKFAGRFDPKIVTHVIVNTTGKENAAKSTLKYLQGVAHRKWIVSYRWVEDCVKKEKILDEAPYEATTFYDDIFPAPRNSRLRERDLFEGFVFVCIGPYDNVTPAEYQDLLLATGATVVDSLKDLDKKEGLKGILIQDGVHDNKVIENWYRTAKAAPILVDWIVDCIGRYKLLKLASYVQYLSPQDYYALGYPRDLIEDEECSDDDLLIIK